MGEKVKRKHAAQFRHLQDEAYGTLADPNLFSNRQQFIARAYRCRGNGRPVLVGNSVILIPNGNGHVLVLHGNSPVGEVMDEKCATLTTLKGKEPKLNVGEISEQSALTGDFLVVCGVEAEEDDVDCHPVGSRRRNQR